MATRVVNKINTEVLKTRIRLESNAMVLIPVNSAVLTSSGLNIDYGHMQSEFGKKSIFWLKYDFD